MRNQVGEKLNGWRKLFLTTGGIVALALVIVLGLPASPRLQAQVSAVQTAQTPKQAGGSSGGVEILTPTEGVNFDSYLQRMVNVVKRNWDMIMPESVLRGDKGRVAIQFRIMRNGSIQEQHLVSSSTKDPLDRAASAAISASSPFEPLPTAFSGPYIELRFTFFYNMGPNDQ